MPLIQLWINSNYTMQGSSLDLEPNRQEPANNWRKQSSIFTKVSLTKKRLFFLKEPRNRLYKWSSQNKSNHILNATIMYVLHMSI